MPLQEVEEGRRIRCKGEYTRLEGSLAVLSSSGLLVFLMLLIDLFLLIVDARDLYRLRLLKAS